MGQELPTVTDISDLYDIKITLCVNSSLLVNSILANVKFLNFNSSHPTFG